MSYSLVIEGLQGARKVRSDTVPRRGEWLSVKLGSSWWWLQVLEVGHALSEEEEKAESFEGCDFVHERAESIVFSSLALATRVDVEHADDGYKLIMPPPRWPYGGKSAKEVLGEVGWTEN